MSEVELYCGNCMEVLPTLEVERIGLVLTDPPWGSGTACNSQRFTRRRSPWWSNVDNSKVRVHEDIVDDNKEFDPRVLLQWDCILWGANWYTRHLPHSGGWLIWDKRKGAESMAANGWRRI